MENSPCGPILIIEDDPDIRESLKLALELEGYDIRTANNGREGLAILAKFDRPCLILLDLMMPVMNGWEFLQAVRHDHFIATIPVVVVSAVAERAETPGLAGYVKKPVNLDLLCDLVRQYCTIPHTAAESA